MPAQCELEQLAALLRRRELRELVSNPTFLTGHGVVPLSPRRRVLASRIPAYGRVTEATRSCARVVAVAAAAASPSCRASSACFSQL